MKILFVCTANISRSFLAEQLLNYETTRLKLKDVSCTSAGLSARPGYPPDPVMVAFLQSQEKTISEHRSRPVSRELIDWADLVLVMERYHQQRILEQWPETRGKTRLLGEFLIYNGFVDDIIDPYGKTPSHYRLAQSQIGLAVQNLIENMLLPSAENHA